MGDQETHSEDPEHLWRDPDAQSCLGREARGPRPEQEVREQRPGEEEPQKLQDEDDERFHLGPPGPLNSLARLYQIPGGRRPVIASYLLGSTSPRNVRAPRP